MRNPEPGGIPWRPRRRPPIERGPGLALFLIVLLVTVSGQTAGNKVNPVDPLPQDSGRLGLKQMLLRLNTTARLMHTTAHPDDEDGGMLTLESRGEGVTALLLTLNRGEGGQNKVGSNLFDVLGVLRTLELTASDRYYGVEQRFSRVADFGFSKSADETFQKWGGHEIALADMVRVIRTFRPDVLVSRFNGTDRDGHGHHQAAGIISREAFRAAADPNRFPEQIAAGLQPWQAKKFYIDNVCPFRSNECPEQNYTLKLSTGEKDPALGMTYIQFAMEGLRHQLSQGAGGWSVDAGPHYAFYKLVDSVLPPTTDKNGHEKDFFDGIDTSLLGLASRLGQDEAKIPLLRPAFVKLQADVDQATKAADADPSSASAPLLDGLQVVRQAIRELDHHSGLSAPEKASLVADLQTKQEQLGVATSLALGVSIDATVDGPVANTADNAFMAVPGQPFSVTIKIANHGSESVTLTDVQLDLKTSKSHNQEVDHTARPLASNQQVVLHMRMTTPQDAGHTRPYWHRDDPETESINRIDDPQYATLPFPPPPLQVHAHYAFHGKESVISTVAMVTYKDATAEERKRALAIGPPFSLELEPASMVIPVSHEGAAAITVGVQSNVPGPISATLRLEVPDGWQAQPGEQAVTFENLGEPKRFDFRVFPANLHEGRHQVKVTLVYQGHPYNEGYTVVTRDDLDTFYYYQPAIQHVSVVEVKVPSNLKVGYIMGAGDDIPTVLKQVGVDVSMIAPEKLASEDLSRYDTIVVGIRAYDTQKEVVVNNKRLLEYVSAGGTLIVQYETGVSDFNNGHFTPYPAQLSRARVSVEESPVEILAPEDSVFHFPNQISQKDFDGWVQERGLYFMDQWDKNFKPLLACHDPGEQPQQGGLLRAQYGKGTYIYTGYAFFRQLPAGVPGAVRLYVNLLSAGHEKQ